MDRENQLFVDVHTYRVFTVGKWDDTKSRKYPNNKQQTLITRAYEALRTWLKSCFPPPSL